MKVDPKNKLGSGSYVSIRPFSLQSVSGSTSPRFPITKSDNPKGKKNWPSNQNAALWNCQRNDCVFGFFGSDNELKMN